MGGRNITIHIAAQSRAQLRQRWGDTGAAAILNNAATLMLFGGGKDTDDLTSYSTLTGDRWQTLPADHSGADRVAPSLQRVQVLSAAQIAQLPFRRVLVIRRGMAPAVGRVQVVWQRRDVKTHPRRVAWADTRQRWIARRERWGQLRENAMVAVAGWLEVADARWTTWRAARTNTMPVAPVVREVPGPRGEATDAESVEAGPVESAGPVDGGDR
jgi:hypothetical protein